MDLLGSVIRRHQNSCVSEVKQGQIVHITATKTAYGRERERIVRIVRIDRVNKYDGDK